MPWGYCGSEIWDACRRAEVAVLVAERPAAVELLHEGNDHKAALPLVEAVWRGS